jgi:transposase InsO family protein
MYAANTASKTQPVTSGRVSTRESHPMTQLIEVYGKAYEFRLDNGLKMTSEKLNEWAKEQGIVLMFIQPGKPNQNAFLSVSTEASEMRC